jgi:hypothetical protein
MFWRTASSSAGISGKDVAKSSGGLTPGKSLPDIWKYLACRVASLGGETFDDEYAALR